MNKLNLFFLMMFIMPVCSQEAPLPVLNSDILESIIEKLIEVEAPTETEALYIAAENVRNFFKANKKWRQLMNKPSFVGKIIEKLANLYAGGNVVDAAHALGSYTAGQWLTKHLGEKLQLTPLIMAIEMRYKNLVNYLISIGTDVNEKDADGNAPLMIAAQDCQATDIIEALINAGAQINVTDVDNNTPLHWAVINECDNNIRVLTDHHAGVNAKDNENQTPLFIAATNGNITIVETLLEAHADPNIAGNGGYTPLMNAAEESHLEVIRALLQHGAQVNQKNENDETALDIAYDAEGPEREQIIELLRAAQEKQAIQKPKRKRGN